MKNFGDVDFFLLFSSTVVTAHSRAFFGQGRGPIFLDDLRCTGQEPNISSCRARRHSLIYCSHSEDAGVTCSSTRKFHSTIQR